jgi:hypothetical protein
MVGADLLLVHKKISPDLLQTLVLFFLLARLPVRHLYHFHDILLR